MSLEKRLFEPVRTFDLVAIDIDGTLLDSQNRLSSEIAPLLRELERRGAGVTLISGRGRLKMLPLLRALDLTLPYVGAGGAYIADLASGQVLMHCALRAAEAAAIVDLARADSAPIISQDPDNIYFEGSLEDLEHLIASAQLNVSSADSLRIDIRRVEDIIEACAEPSKLSIYGQPDYLSTVRERLQRLALPLYMTYSEPVFLEITRQGINKGAALKVLADYLHVPLARVLVIGDSPNDVSMFQVAGMAVAMGNALAEVKAAADVIAPSNDEGGVAWVLRELLLAK